MVYLFASVAALALSWWTVALIHHNRNRDTCSECQRRANFQPAPTTEMIDGDEVAARDRHPSPSTYWASECAEPGCYCHELH